MRGCRASVLAALVLVAACARTQPGRRCSGAIRMPCVLGEVCVYVSAQDCVVCRCEEPSYVPRAR